MKLILAIQGTRLQAVTAAENRSIKFRVLREGDRGCTVGEVHESYRDRVLNWYEENGGEWSSRGTPYPAGTLMSVTDA